MDASDPSAEGPPDPCRGLTQVRPLAPERVPIRTRESGATLSGWRLGVATGEGDGAIFAIDGPDGATIWRGDGVFLGWTSQRLSAAYGALLPTCDERPLEFNQLG